MLAECVESVGTGRQKQLLLFFFLAHEIKIRRLVGDFLVLFLRSGRPQDGPEEENQRTASRKTKRSRKEEEEVKEKSRRRERKRGERERKERRGRNEMK